MGNLNHVFSSLTKPIQKIISEKGFLSPTDPQSEAIPLISNGKNVLLIAPTGTGKTEAAFLPILNKLIQIPRKIAGIKILYITPLRALNRDILERLEWWCSRLDVKIAVRHGDTDGKERVWQARSPPDLLVTTPETLQAILPGRIMRGHLKSVRWVIVDEINEFAEDKRGSQLSLALQRLRWITGEDFQLIGLSATIGSPNKVAKFLVGQDSEVEVVKVPVARHMKLEVVYPAPSLEDDELASKLYTHPEVAARLRLIRDLMSGHRSALLFTNTRAIAEVLASRFKVWDVNFPISIHHGSLAKPARVAAERGLKDGGLKGLVCTSSLELGIDVGRIDLCIQYMSPRQITRILQRVGRSGHRIGRVSSGVIITMDSDDTLEALVVARRAYLEALEEVTVPEKPYDVLCHQIIGLLTQQRQLSFTEIIHLFNKAYPYRNLDEKDLVSVVRYLNDRYPRLAFTSFENKLVGRSRESKSVYKYYYENLSMIPDEKKYLVIDNEDDSPVGVLDEVFVAEHGEPGTKFIIKGSVWKVLDVYGDKVYVKAQDDPTGAIPSWVGEEIPVPFEVAQEVGEIRAYVAKQMKSGKSIGWIVSRLASRYPAKKETILRAIDDTVKQVGEGIPIPSDKRMTIEDWDDYIIIHAFFGSLVNKTLARLLGHILSEKTGHTIGVQQDPYRIIIQTNKLADSSDLVEVIKEACDLRLREVIVKASSKTGLFKRRIIHVARRFGAIARGVDMGSIGISQLLKNFDDTAIFEEAIKEALDKDLNLEGTRRVLKDIKNGKIQLLCLEERDKPTPIAKVGLEKIGRRSDLIPPDKMRHIIIASVKARILNEVRTLVCTNCWEYFETKKMIDLPENIRCSICNSSKIGISTLSKGDILKLKAKRSRMEKRIIKRLEKTAQLTSKYGKIAALTLAGKNINPEDAETILRDEKTVNDRFFELIIEAEKKSLRKKFF